ncbi:type II toxin-antitoxin system RelB/DinJ family antitoxin [Mesorhizobium sp. WSM4884]|uniref:antitoxin PaaA2 family protein n=1 Tax=Mesorhizobium sp. WSM4884 TaxID=3038542 RepID=UPI0024166177|nr:type II toxin-antitoxin system RelB/DinJ family antitoxin [Mesorhizobium sp. WSM4884]MDG4883817.1 type II toxin-antitoxin system RelB/DinJ family antitoxin [Mesorhizobium sp. WSM4884]
MKNKVVASRQSRAGKFVLTRDKGEKICAVEGLKLSPRMGAALKEGDAKGLSGDERRALIKEQAQHNKAYDLWFRAKVQQALDDSRSDIPDDQAKAHFAERRAAAAGRK